MYVCVFRCLAIRFLVAFVSFVIFTHISAGFFMIHTNALYSLPFTIHLAHSLENWVQHDLFTIRKYVLRLQHTTDMIIFLLFVRFHCDKLLFDMSVTRFLFYSFLSFLFLVFWRKKNGKYSKPFQNWFLCQNNKHH